MKISRIAAVSIGAGLVVGAIQGQWPIVILALIALVVLALLEKV